MQVGGYTTGFYGLDELMVCFVVLLFSGITVKHVVKQFFYDDYIHVDFDNSKV